METVEQVAKTTSYSICNACNEIGFNQVKEAFEQGVDFAQRWIPVEEELPELLTDVLLRCKYGKVVIGCLMMGGFNVEMTSDEEVISWRHIYLK